MLSIIVAYDKNNVIGKDNQLPWHLPNDLAYFKKVTTGKTVVMGRKTFESIGKALPNRRNIVLTTDEKLLYKDAILVHSINDILSLDKLNEEVFIIGGETLFKQMLPYVQKVYVTFIDEEFEGDTYFPEIENNNWKRASNIKGEKNNKNPYNYFFQIYEKK